MQYPDSRLTTALTEQRFEYRSRVRPSRDWGGAVARFVTGLAGRARQLATYAVRRQQRPGW